MSDTSSTAAETQDPTPGEAQRSTSPSEEKAMSSTTAEGTTGTPTASASSTVTEQPMSNETSSTPPSSGPTTGSSNTPAAASPPATNGDSTKSGSEQKRSVDRYNPRKVQAAGTKVRKLAEGSSDPKIIADIAELDAASASLSKAQGVVGYATDQVSMTAKARTDTDAALVEALMPVEWYLRVRPGGRKFVRDCQRSTALATAEQLFAALTTSGYDVPENLVQELQAKHAEARAANETHAQARKGLAAAAEQYVAAKTQTRAAIAMLRGSLQWVKANARAASVKPARGTLRVAKPASAHAKAKKKDS